MSEAFWWYVLAGFLLGFSVSTLWEWVYFRRRRMNIRDRRIAELEATVRAYTAAASVPNDGAVTDDWAEPTFQSPGVYLETEDAPPSAPAPDTLSSTQNPSPAVVTTAATAPLRTNGASSAMMQLAGGASATVAAVSVPGGFQSLAVQHSPPSSRAETRPAALAAVHDDAAEDSYSGAVLAAHGAEPVVSRMADDATTNAAAVASAAVASAAVASAADANGRTVATTPVYANGATGVPTPAKVDYARNDDAQLEQGAPTLAEVDSRTRRGDSPAITSVEIGVLVSSINELIETASQEQRAENVAPLLATPPTTASDDLDGASVRISGRTEYVLVRIVQSFVQFIRQLRQIITGAEAPRPAVRPASTLTSEDDLTQIAGLSSEHAARLRAAGVTTYARLAALSPDELRMITLTPGDADIDPVQWQMQAQQLAIATQQRGEPA